MLQKMVKTNNSILYGILSGLGLLVFYLSFVSIFQGIDFAFLNLRSLWYLIFPLVIGFGIQIWLYSSIRHTAKLTGTVAGTGGVSVCDSSLATCPLQDTYLDDFTIDNALSTQLSAFSAGSRTLRAEGVMLDFPNLGDVTACDPQATTTINIIDQPSWAQFKEGDAITNGSISIPVVAGSYLMSYDTDEYPGIPIAEGSVTANPGGISTPQNWRSENPAYEGVLPSFSGFRNRLPSSFTPSGVSGGSADEFELTNGVAEYPTGSGYYFFEHAGSDLTLLESSDGSIDLGTRRVIIFADGDVSIMSKIRLTPGQGFFMVIATGDIIVAPSVAGPQEDPLIPDLEGVYYTDQNFETGTTGADLDDQINVRGVVVAGDQITLQRNLGDDALKPGELFEFAPDQAMLIPPALSKMQINWRETLP